jgi:putative DNA primase/helicase
MTKITAIAPSGECPLFLGFLDRITGSDHELAAYVRRAFGYALTGLTREHALFFAHRTGANGKSVLLSTVAGILGDYHRTAPIETFTAANGERHPTDLAGLRGARLVSATETEEGRRWAESRVKQLTGGDVISARFMRLDFFEFLRPSGCSSPATISPAFVASTRQSGGASILSRSPYPFPPTSATASWRRS